MKWPLKSTSLNDPLPPFVAFNLKSSNQSQVALMGGRQNKRIGTYAECYKSECRS